MSPEAAEIFMRCHRPGADGSGDDPRIEKAARMAGRDDELKTRLAEQAALDERCTRIVNTILHLPLSPFRTRAWFVVRVWTRAPGSLVRPIVLARGRGILKQDASMLASQAESIRHFGGERW